MRNLTEELHDSLNSITHKLKLSRLDVDLNTGFIFMDELNFALEYHFQNF